MADRPPRPTITDAPGLTWKPRKSGWEARWQARSDLVARGYRVKSFGLWEGSEPTESDIAFIRDRCKSFQAEMLAWGHGGVPVATVFDGTVRSLIGCFQTDPDSSFHGIRHGTKMTYGSAFRRIEADHGNKIIADIRNRDMRTWHRDWLPRGVTAAHGLMSKCRTLFAFGAAILEDEECKRLKDALGEMKFRTGGARTERLTAEQANLIRAAAHRRGWHSIALAQAFQFELVLRQRDVIGEWVPLDEPEISDITNGNVKWVRGIRRNEIDESLILRHITSKRQKPIERDLHNALMIMEELAWLPADGALIIREDLNLPYKSSKFRERWRELARECGVPDTVWNMDSRAGGITEADEAGSEIEDIRQLATHSNASMTRRYTRDEAKKAASVMQLRAAHRGKNEG